MSIESVMPSNHLILCHPLLLLLSIFPSIRVFSNESVLSLVSIIVLLVWLYLCGNILFLAIAFTGVWYRDRNL